MIMLRLNISARPVPEKFELYEWLREQGWQADHDYHMYIIEGCVGLGFTDPGKATLTKLAWGAQPGRNLVRK